MDTILSFFILFHNPPPSPYMKQKITDEIKEILSQSVNWAKLEVEYIKLTAAEKLIVLLSTMIILAVVMVLLLPVFIMLLFALADVFKLFMVPALAYLSVAGIVLVLILLLFVFRKTLVIDPVARFMTRLILEKHSANNHNP